MPTLYHCDGCLQFTTNPTIMINIDEATLNKVSFLEDGRKVIDPIKIVGQHFLCGPRCASLFMLDMFTRKDDEYEGD